MYIFISSSNIAKNCIFFYISVQHTGVGYTQINGILAELNIPPISKTLLYTRQEEVGQAIESVASSSINDALQEEVEATTKNKRSTSITVSVDGGGKKEGAVVPMTV